MDFGRVLEANMASKIDKNRKNLRYNEFSTTRISRGLFVKIKVSGLQKSVKFHKNTKKNPTKIVSQFSMPLGGQHGAQNPPKTRPKSMKDRWKMGLKIDENFECILRGFLVALGANMAPKASQKPLPRGGVLSSLFLTCWALEGSWGALGASWGPRADFNRFLVDFWWILVDFWWIFG